MKQLLAGTRNDVAPGTLLVADVIERGLKLHRGRYGDRAFAERWSYLQLRVKADVDAQLTFEAMGQTCPVETSGGPIH